jgi:hypothetical protein
MAKAGGQKPVDFEVVMDGGFVQSMTLDGEPLPLNHIRGYAIHHDGPMDVPTVTVTFIANPIIRHSTEADSQRRLAAALRQNVGATS